MSIKVTRNGRHILQKSDGTQISQHTDIKEAYERASTLATGKYKLVTADETIDVTQSVAGVGPTAVLAVTSNVDAAVTVSTAGTVAGSAALSGWTIKWGDGTYDAGEGVPPATATHTYKAAATLVITLEVFDTQGKMARFLTSAITVTPPTPLPIPDPPPLPVAGNYYVATTGSDSNPGTLTAPWRTISYGVSQMVPGSTLYIRGGSYTGASNVIDSEQFTVPSGLSNNRIMICGYQGENVTITPPNGQQAIRLSIGTPAYLTFKSLTLDGINGTVSSPSGGPDLVYLSTGAHHNRFENLIVKRSSANGFTIANNNGESVDNEIIDCTIHDNGRLSEGNSGYGIYLTGSRNIIDGNLIYNNNGYGIHHLPSSGQGNDNIIRSNVIRNNTVHGTIGVGGSSAYGIVISGGDNNLIANNLIYANQGGILLYGGLTVQSSNTLVYNNTITANVGTAGESGVDCQFYSSVNPPIIKNNIIYNNTGGDLKDYGQDSSTSTADGTAIATHNVCATFAGITPTNNITSDPLFTDAANADFTLQSSSPAINMGTTLVAVTTDIADVTRPVSSVYDIGAYEFTGIVTPPPVPTTRTLLGGWRLGQDYPQGCIAIDFTRMKCWMGGRATGDTILEFDLPAMGTGTNPSSWPRVLPVRTIQPWWPTSQPGAVDMYTNGLVWWQNKLWAAPRSFYALDPASTAPLKIYAQDGQVMTFPTLTMQKFAGFVKRGPGLDPYLGCGGYESGQGSQSGPSLATLAGVKLIEYQWPADPGPIDPATGKPVNWDLRAPRDTNYSVDDPGHEWIGWTPRLINGVLEGRWATDKLFGGGLVLPEGITYWSYAPTGPIAYSQQQIMNPLTYEYKYHPTTFQFMSFTYQPVFGDGPVLGQELGPDGKVYLAHGGKGASSLFSPQDIYLRVFG